MKQDLARYEAEQRNVDRKIADAYTKGEAAGVSVGQLKAQAPYQEQIQRIHGEYRAQLHQRETQLRAMQAELKAGDPVLNAELNNLRKQIQAMEQQKGTAQAASTAALASTEKQQREKIAQIQAEYRAQLYTSEQQMKALKQQLAAGDPSLDQELASLKEQLQAMDTQRAEVASKAQAQAQVQAAQVTSAENLAAQVKEELSRARRREDTAATEVKSVAEQHRSRMAALHASTGKEPMRYNTPWMQLQRGTV